MNNAEKFKSQFGLYASELWAMPEKEFLMWLNAEFQPAVPEMAIDAWNRRATDGSESETR